jgi:hypothetical protein
MSRTGDLSDGRGMKGATFVLVLIGAVALRLALWLTHHMSLCPTSAGASGDRGSGSPIGLPADDREATSWS